MALVNYQTTLKEWENIIRVKMKVTNPALLKSGALGVLTNYLAGIKYDALQFYSKTFQELNVGLAQDFNSMLYHSSIYGADPTWFIDALPYSETSSLPRNYPRFPVPPQYLAVSPSYWKALTNYSNSIQQYYTAILYSNSIQQ